MKSINRHTAIANIRPAVFTLPVMRRPNWLIIRETAYAKQHWYVMANNVHFALFISLLIAPIAAKQGAQRRLNTRNE